MKATVGGGHIVQPAFRYLADYPTFQITQKKRSSGPTGTHDPREGEKDGEGKRVRRGGAIAASNTILSLQ